MSDVPDETIDRLLAGELPAAEQRRIAQAALDDPDLFEQLTAAGVVANSVDTKRETTPPGVLNSSSTAPGSRWTRPRVVVMTLAVAAAIVLAVAIGSSRSARRPPATGSIATAPVVPAAIAPPLLLIARADAASPPAFRAEAGTSRPPRQTGTIVSVHDGELDLDLGSLDGLTQGSELRAVAHGRDGARGGSRVRITVVFRERSRGRLAAGAQMQPGDRVDVDPAVHVAAILEQAAARSAAGDLPGARSLAQLAVSRARPADVSADVRRRSLDRLGRLEHQAGDLDAAASHLAAAADEFDVAPPATPDERAGVLNELGAIRIEQRNFVAAEQALQSAQSYATGILLMRVTNNLGAVAALRGDLAAADTLYRQAQSLAGESAGLAADRDAIARNLDGLKSSR